MRNLQDALMRITSENHEKNKKILCKEFGSLEYTDGCGNTLYHLIINCYTSFAAKTYAIETLINYIPNYLNNKNTDGDTFIHYAIKNYVDMRDVVFILNAAQVHGFDVNAKNNNGYSLLHIAILFIKRQEDLLKFTHALINLDFNLDVLDPIGMNLISFIDEQYHLNETVKSNLKRMITSKGKDYRLISTKSVENTTNNHKATNKYGTVLNYKDYPYRPAIGRENEVNKIIISLATDKKLPLLVGPSGVGKTTIVDELAYQIKNNGVPNFLRDKKIYEVHMSNLLAGTKYRGDFENNMREVMEYAKAYNAILFIDEFHMVFGAGASENDKTDAAGMLKSYIDRYGIKIIGATTEAEYEAYMAHDALKRRFEVIRVRELSDNKLSDIAINTINNLSEKSKIDLSDYFYNNMEQIINILLELTRDKHRRYDDKLYNPDLLISIIDRAFAYSLVEDDNEVDVKHLILAIEDCERIYDHSKEVAIYNLNNMSMNESLVKSKIIDLNQYKKEHALV